MSKDRTKLDKAGESAGINVSMLKTVPIVPVNSVQSLSGRNSVRMESLNSTSKNLLEKSNQKYDKIKTTERSRVKTDVIAQNEYFQVRKKIDIKQRGPKISNRDQISSIINTSFEDYRVYNDEEDSLIIELHETSAEKKCKLQARIKKAGDRRNVNMFQKKNVEEDAWSQKVQVRKKKIRRDRNKDVDYQESGSDVSSNHSSKIQSRDGSRYNYRIKNSVERGDQKIKNVENYTGLLPLNKSPKYKKTNTEAPASPQTLISKDPISPIKKIDQNEKNQFLNQINCPPKEDTKKDQQSLEIDLTMTYLTNINEAEQTQEPKLEKIQEEENESDKSISLALNPSVDELKISIHDTSHSTLDSAMFPVDIKLSVKVPQNALFSNKLVFQLPDDLTDTYFDKLITLNEFIYIDPLISPSKQEDLTCLVKEFTKMYEEKKIGDKSVFQSLNLNSIEEIIPEENPEISFSELIKKVEL